MKKLELSYEMERALGKNRNTVLALWYKIAYYQEKHGYCDKTNPELAKALKVSLSTIERAIRKLINLGLVLKVKAHFWSRTLFAVRPTLARENLLENCSRGTECEATTDGTTDGTSDGIYINNKKINNKIMNNVVSIKEEPATLKEIEIEILNDEFDEETVSKSIHIFNMNKNEKEIYNAFKYTHGICLNLIRNKKSLERKEAKKRKQLAFFEKLAANRTKTQVPAVDPSYYYDWISDLDNDL